MRTIIDDEEKYLNVSDYLDHLHTAIQTVQMMTDGIMAPNAPAVIDTLKASIAFLETL